ncbi:MAG: STAS/SEC14 domain-containing protein [Pyrinomonadaceae bacterium]
MIEIIDLKKKDILGFRASGKIEKDDMTKVLDLLSQKAEGCEKLRFYAEIDGFRIQDMSAEAVKEEIKFWLRNPGILPKLEKAVLVSDQDWLKKIFDLECALIPTLTGKSFSREEKELAVIWLETDQRADSRMDLTSDEFVQSSLFKFAGGFAVGLLTAGLLSRKQQKNLGAAVLFGTLAGGIPLGLKILNNNKQLLDGMCDETKNLGDH